MKVVALCPELTPTIVARNLVCPERGVTPGIRPYARCQAWDVWLGPAG